jgi:hypothetical protein
MARQRGVKAWMQLLIRFRREEKEATPERKIFNPPLKND